VFAVVLALACSAVAADVIVVIISVIVVGIVAR